MPRFVVLEHDHPTLHWDLMLEAGEALQTWRLGQPPTTSAVIDATALADHRLAYFDYEGPVSGNRGTVRRWDTGEFAETTDSLPNARKLSLRGERIQGTILLEQVEGTCWRFVQMP
jgi:hypothetical protein